MSIRFRPGRLTREYVDGRHRRLAGPIPLFLIANLAFFTIHTLAGVNPITMPLFAQLTRAPWHLTVRDGIRDRMTREGADFNTLRRRFDASRERQAGLLVILMVPPFALLVWLTQAFRRKPPAMHLVFALHTYAFVLWLATLLELVLAAVLFAAPGLAGHGIAAPGFEWLLILGAVLTYLIAAVHVAYGERTLPSVLKGGVLAAGIAGIFQVYRFLLFFAVFYTV